MLIFKSKLFAEFGSRMNRKIAKSILKPLLQSYVYFAYPFWKYNTGVIYICMYVRNYQRKVKAVAQNSVLGLCLVLHKSLN